MKEFAYATTELNTFELVCGDHFLYATNVDETTHLFRYNNFNGSPPSRTNLGSTNPAYAGYLDAAGTFY